MHPSKMKAGDKLLIVYNNGQQVMFTIDDEGNWVNPLWCDTQVMRSQDGQMKMQVNFSMVNFFCESGQTLGSMNKATVNDGSVVNVYKPEDKLIGEYDNMVQTYLAHKAGIVIPKKGMKIVNPNGRQ